MPFKTCSSTRGRSRGRLASGRAIFYSGRMARADRMAIAVMALANACTHAVVKKQTCTDPMVPP